jgi:hypothetical protein
LSRDRAHEISREPPMDEKIWVVVGCAVVLITTGVLLKLLLDALGGLETPALTVLRRESDTPRFVQSVIAR